MAAKDKPQPHLMDYKTLEQLQTRYKDDKGLLEKYMEELIKYHLEELKRFNKGK